MLHGDNSSQTTDMVKMLLDNGNEWMGVGGGEGDGGGGVALGPNDRHTRWRWKVIQERASLSRSNY